MSEVEGEESKRTIARMTEEHAALVDADSDALMQLKELHSVEVEALHAMISDLKSETVDAEGLRALDGQDRTELMGMVDASKGTIAQMGTEDVEDRSVNMPDGALKMPDGSVKMPNASVTMSDGSFKMPDGRLQHSDGSITTPEVDVSITTSEVDGSITTPEVSDGSTTTPEVDGSITTPEVACYTCLKSSLARASFDMESEMRAVIHVGMSLDTTERRVNEDGAVRIKFAEGWVSEKTANGLLCFQRVDPDVAVSTGDGHVANIAGDADAVDVHGAEAEARQAAISSWAQKAEDVEQLRALEQQHKTEFTRMLDTEAGYRAQVEALQEEVNAERAKAEAAEMADVQGGVAKLQEVLEGMKVHCCMLEMPWLIFSSMSILFLAPRTCPDDEEACCAARAQVVLRLCPTVFKALMLPCVGGGVRGEQTNHSTDDRGTRCKRG